MVERRCDFTFFNAKNERSAEKCVANVHINIQNAVVSLKFTLYILQDLGHSIFVRFKNKYDLANEDFYLSMIHKYN